MKIKTIRSKEDITEYVNSDLYKYADIKNKLSPEKMEDNLLKLLDKYEQFSFDIIDGNIWAAIENGQLIFSGEID